MAIGDMKTVITKTGRKLKMKEVKPFGKKHNLHFKIVSNKPAKTQKVPKKPKADKKKNTAKKDKKTKTPSKSQKGAKKGDLVPIGIIFAPKK